MPKESNMRQNVYKTSTAFTVLATYCHWAWSLPRFKYAVRIHWRKFIFPFHADVNWGWLLG